MNLEGPCKVDPTSIPGRQLDGIGQKTCTVFSSDVKKEQKGNHRGRKGRVFSQNRET